MKTTTRSLAILSIWAIAVYPALAQQSAPPTFQSPAEAVETLLKAVDSNDEPAIQKILGGSAELTSSRVEDQDKADRALFCEKYSEMHRLHREPDGSVVLYLGVENWPFPVPLVQKSGAWRFDPDAGKQEVMFRQIGENELTAIAICHEFGAGKKRNQTNADATSPSDDSPAGIAAKVSSESSGRPILFYGYYFRLTPTRGGTALLAYPAEYRSTGVMTFATTGNDIVYQKDLGPKSSELGSAMAAFRKDASWRAAR